MTKDPLYGRGLSADTIVLVISVINVGKGLHP